MVYFIYDTIHDYIYEGTIYYTLDDTTVDAQNHIRKLEEYAKAIPYSSNKLVVPIIIKMPNHTRDVTNDEMLDFARRYIGGKTTTFKSVAISNSIPNSTKAHLTINEQSGNVVCDNCGMPVKSEIAIAPDDINYCYHCGAKFLNTINTINMINTIISTECE